MTTTDVRLAASKMLDGMKINKEKLARDCVAVCNQVDRLSAALIAEQQKNAALTKALEEANRARDADSGNGLNKEFADIFGDIFAQKTQRS